MDILHLIDRLEETVKESKRLPFSGLRMVDERHIWPLIDQMRISVPDQVRRAERVIREKERTIAQANEEAERIVSLARNEAAQLTAGHALVQAAEEQAAAIREQAEREAEELVIKVERSHGRKAERVSETNHYDVRSKGRREVRFIEVKSRIQGNDIKIKLTPMEGEFAKKEPRSWLYIVFGLRSRNPVILAIKNPMKRLPFKIDKQVIIKNGYKLKI